MASPIAHVHTTKSSDNIKERYDHDISSDLWVKMSGTASPDPRTTRTWFSGKAQTLHSSYTPKNGVLQVKSRQLRDNAMFESACYDLLEHFHASGQLLGETEIDRL